MADDSFAKQMQSKFQGLKPVENDITTEIKSPVSEKMMTLLRQVLKSKEAVTELLKQAILEIEHGETEKAEVYVKKFLTMNESHFLQAKPLFYFRKQSPETDVNAYVLYGRSDSFPCMLSKEKEAHYVFRLPPMVSRRTYESYQASSRHIKYSMMLLIDSFEQDEPVVMMKNPVVVFRHHIADRTQIPDADNLDVKVAIDTMQNIFIPNDCLLDMMLLSYGVQDSEAYTEIHVMEREIFREWI